MSKRGLNRRFRQAGLRSQFLQADGDRRRSPTFRSTKQIQINYERAHRSIMSDQVRQQDIDDVGIDRIALHSNQYYSSNCHTVFPDCGTMRECETA